MGSINPYSGAAELEGHRATSLFAIGSCDSSDRTAHVVGAQTWDCVLVGAPGIDERARSAPGRAGPGEEPRQPALGFDRDET